MAIGYGFRFLSMLHIVAAINAVDLYVSTYSVAIYIYIYIYIYTYIYIYIYILLLGEFSNVHKGVWTHKDTTSGKEISEIVAIKTIKCKFDIYLIIDHEHYRYYTQLYITAFTPQLCIYK